MALAVGTDHPAPEADDRPVYLDCNATTPVDPRVREEVLHYLTEEFGNAGSRTHTYGQTAKDRVNRARVEVAAVVSATAEEVIFTSGATESNNLALLGLAPYGHETGRRHVVSTRIEHKAILEPLERMDGSGFEVTLVSPTAGGWVDPDAVASAVRQDTLAVSVMAVNNETGIVQPIAEIAERLVDHDAYMHVDAAQGFGKNIEPLRSPRIDLISVSGHKLYAPKGIGALVARRRGYRRPPLRPLVYGGGQERGLRPGTLPVALIAGLGTAARIALDEHGERDRICAAFRRQLLAAIEPLGPRFNGDQERMIAHTINFSLPGLDSEAAMLALKDVAAVSNGSACTSQSYEPSHVLTAMGLADDQVRGALRLSWCYMTAPLDWSEIVERLRPLATPPAYSDIPRTR